MVDTQDMVWSFSRISSFDTCPFGWYKSYIEKEKGIGNGFASFGSFCHELLEKYALGELEEWDLLDEYEKNFKAEIPYQFPYNKYVDLEQSYYDDGYSYFSNFNGFGDNIEVVGVEIKINTVLKDKYKFLGYIDLLLRDTEDDEYIVLDHKSKASFKSIKERKEYARQLYLYSQYVYENYGKFPKMLVFNMFRKQKRVEIPFDKLAYNEAIDWAYNTIEEICSAVEYPAKKNQFYCKNLCNHREVCDE